MTNYYLKIPGRPAQPLSQAFFTVGFGTGYDICLDGKKPQALFTIQSRGQSRWLLPGDEKVFVNGKRVATPETLQVSDRIHWDGGAAVFLDGPLANDTAAQKDTVFTTNDLLQDFVASLERGAGSEEALERILPQVARQVGAERGFLISDLEGENQWDILASFGEPGDNRDVRRRFISSTILNQCLQERRSVAIESVIGHPLEKQYSILSAQVFSVACIPLVLGERILGALYFSTHSPGSTIRKEALDAVQSLGIQLSLVLLAQEKAVPAAPRKTSKDLSSQWVFSDERGPMKEIDTRLTKLAATDLNVLILGETGTGKERAARVLHNRSPRSQGPFVAVNCGAIPPSLIESTLFGHVKGAFTGAHRDQKGKFQLADGGTLFLDEIGDMPLEVQVKLLRAIQEGEVEPVGGQPVKVNIRIVAATHQALDVAIAEKKFREDLYYRIHGAGVVLPPLRDRLADVGVLATHFAESIAPGTRLSSDAIEKLCAHSWPGNVRELQQVIQRSIALASGSVLQADDIDFGARLVTPAPSVGVDAASLKDGKSKFTLSFVNRVLERHGGNRAKTARELGISERSLYRILASEKTDSMF